MSSVREYPPKPMTANTTTIAGASYGNGVYRASESSVGWRPTWKAWKVFDGIIEGQSSWHSETMLNSQKNGYKGPEWIQLQLPRPIQLNKYAIWSRDEGGNGYHKKDFPNTFKMKGSNNGTSWTTIDTRNNIANTVSNEYEKKEFTVSSSKPYKYFRLEVENVGVDGLGRGTDTNGEWFNPYVVITGLSFYGDEPSGTIWNPLGDGFWSANNAGMWTYIGVVALLILGLMYAFMM